ncbi:MAG TPA: hypothetical protein VN723_08295 [Rhizomicrobium sp.]|jgi:hypothetical protein|nr:hypothetical protein [Rhizomicrobium sp.]
MKKLALSILFTVVLPGCTALVAQQEQMLDDAGFRALPVDTPERQAMLTRLPSRQFVRRMNGSFFTYTYADPLVCNCLYVGSEFAYAAYRRLARAHGSSAFQGVPAYNPPPNPALTAPR